MGDFYLPAIVTMAVAASVLATEIPAACPSKDLINKTTHIGHENDPTKFYICVMGDKHEMDCPEYEPGKKLCFNPEQQQCDWPYNVARCKKHQDSNCPSSEDTTAAWAHPYNCRLFYTCKNGIMNLRSCDKGWLFDPKSRNCALAMEVVCNNPIECPPAGSSEIVLLPHECQCAKYYECWDGELILKNCESGEMFDHNERICVPDEEAACSTGPVTTTTTPPPVIMCPPGNDTTDIPHETNCKFYYTCENGRKQLQECMNGLYFDEIKGMCTWWENVNCGSRASRTIILPDTAPTTTSAPTKTSKNTSSTHTFGDITCPFKGGKKKIPYPGTCNAYYYCEYNEVKMDKCLQGHYFNPVVEECDFVGSPNCSHSNHTDKCIGTCRVRNPDYTDCAWYYECKDGYTEHKKCREGLAFNWRTEMCDLPVYANCTKCTNTNDAVIYCRCPNTTGDKLPHECQRDKYYICENGEAKVRSCPSGWLYDPVKRDCQNPNNKSQGALGCSGTCRVRNPDYTDCAWYYECKDGKTEHKKCREGLAFNWRTEMCDLPVYANCTKCTNTNDAVIYCRCPNTTGDKLPHECQCDKYYICENGDAKVRSCPSGWLYDPVKRDCDVAGNVVCNKSLNNKPQDALGCIGTCPVHNSEHRPPVTYLPHKDCTNFCYCNNGTPFAYKCSRGFHFSKGEQKCTDPAIAQCVSSFTYDDGDQESTNAKETSFWSSIPLIG